MGSEPFHELGQALKEAKSELDRKKITRDLYQEQLSLNEEKWKNLNEHRELLDKVRLLFQHSADHARTQAKQQLETLVTNALQYVFGPMFRFEIDLSDHGGNPTAEFYVVSEWEGQTIKNKPQDSRGGGIVDIVSLALRIALIETIQPRLQGPIILDEPGKHVSEDYIVPMIQFLKSVAETFGRQIILVTHNTHLTESADTAYFVRLASGKSEVLISRHLDNRFV
ncbi:ATP-binding protein [Hazenella coriacea]|uniref:ATPase n=1 Tax=Hazenella coriacea TaxID=1179467 RepID=A0A4R3L071_9BACL|nr:ATP-binding protein [Hazenella coriacea]TCS92594.1 hypothetical protein EDD58_11158 [Hazenella coriacea]